MNEIINQLARQDLMPSSDVIEDFYKHTKLEASLSDQWEQLTEYDTSNLDVPGYPGISAHKAWKVTTQKSVWMIYTWYEAVADEDEELHENDQDSHAYTYSGTEDEVWLYVLKPNMTKTINISHLSPEHKIITDTLTISIAEKDNKTIEIKLNDASIVLNAYEASDLMDFLAGHAALIADQAEAKNERAMRSEMADMNQIRREWQQYRNEGLGPRG